MKQNMITPNETLQLNELLALKNLSLTKSLLMSPMITDADLKLIIKKDSMKCEAHIKELKSFMEKSTVITNQDSHMFQADGGNAK